MQNNPVLYNTSSLQDVIAPEVTSDFLFYKPSNDDIIPIPDITELRNELDKDLKLKSALLTDNSIILSGICKERALNIENIITEFVKNNKHVFSNFSSSLLSGQFQASKSSDKSNIAILLEQIRILLKTAINDLKITKEIKNNLIVQIAGYTDFACIEGSMEKLEKIVQAISLCKVSGVESYLYKIKESFILAYCAMLTNPSSQLNKEQKLLLKDLDILINDESHIHNTNTLWNSVADAFKLHTVKTTKYMRNINENQKNVLISHIKKELNKEFISLLAENIESTIIDLFATLRASGDLKDTAEHTVEQLIEWKICEELPAILVEYGVNYSQHHIAQAKVNDIKKSQINITQVINQNQEKDIISEIPVSKNTMPNVQQEQTEEAKLMAANNRNSNIIVQFDDSVCITRIAKDLPLALRAVIAFSPLMTQYITATKTEIPPFTDQEDKEKSHIGYDVLNTGKEIVIYVNDQIYLVSNENKKKLEQEITLYQNTFIGKDSDIKIYHDQILQFDYLFALSMKVKSGDAEEQIKEYISQQSALIDQQQLYKNHLKSLLKPHLKIHGLLDTQIDQLLNILNTEQDKDKVKVLFSKNALNIYKLGGEPNAFNDIADIVVLKALTSDIALYCYKNSYFTVADIKNIENLDIKRIDTLLSLNAQECYKKNSNGKSHCTFDYIKNLDIARIEALTAKNAQICYENEYFTLADLNNLENKDIAIIKALINNNARKCYEKKYLTFDDIKNSDLAIRTLTSVMAQTCYTTHFCTVAQLKNLKDLEKIEALISQYRLKVGGMHDDFHTMCFLYDKNKTLFYLYTGYSMSNTFEDCEKVLNILLHNENEGINLIVKSLQKHISKLSQDLLCTLQLDHSIKSFMDHDIMDFIQQYTGIVKHSRLETAIEEAITKACFKNTIVNEYFNSFKEQRRHFVDGIMKEKRLEIIKICIYSVVIDTLDTIIDDRFRVENKVQVPIGSQYEGFSKIMKRAAMKEKSESQEKSGFIK